MRVLIFICFLSITLLNMAYIVKFSHSIYFNDILLALKIEIVVLSIYVSNSYLPGHLTGGKSLDKV